MEIRIHYVIALVLFLVALSLFNNPTEAYQDSADFYHSNSNITNSIVNPWDIVTIKIYNEAANTDANSVESYQINVNSTSNPTGINLTATETGVNTSTFTAIFQPAETASSNTTSDTYPYPKLNATNNDIISVYSDLDNDGNYTRINMTFNYADEIYVFRNANPSGVGPDAKPDISQRYFSDDSTVYITVYSKAGWPNPNATVYQSTNSSNNITINLTEDSVYEGKYTGSFVIDKDRATDADHINASDSQRINIVSDIGNDNQYTDSFVIVDNTPPTFSSITPANNSFFMRNSTRSISVTINEEYPSFANVIMHYWRLNGTEDINGNDQIDLGEKKSNTMLYSSGSTFTTTIDDTMVPTNGTVYVWVSGTDQAGNALTGGGDWNNPVLTYTIDNTKPELSFVNVENETAESGFDLKVNVDGTYSNISSMTYNITDNTTSVLSSGSLSCTDVVCNLSSIISTIDLPIGLLNLTVFATDIAGNSANKTIQINSTPGIRLDSIPSVIGSQDVPNDGTHSIKIKFDVTLKGDYLKMKLSDFSASTTIFDIDSSCNGGTCAKLEYNKTSGAETVDVKSDYSGSGATTGIIDQGSMNYAKDVIMYLYITIPEALSPGTYNGTYAIQAYG